MRYRTLTALTLLFSLTLTGCTRWALAREVVWAEMGTPARIVDDRLINVLVPDGEGGLMPGQARLQGMVAIDEPTLKYYQTQGKQGSNNGK